MLAAALAAVVAAALLAAAKVSEVEVPAPNPDAAGKGIWMQEILMMNRESSSGNI